MQVFILREYCKFPVNAGDGVANVFFLDQEGELWVDPMLVQVDRAYALEQAGEVEPVMIDKNHIFYRLEWLNKVSGYTGVGRLRMKLDKVTLKEKGELVRTVDQVLEVSGNVIKKH